LRAVQAGVDSRGMTALSSGHLATDLAQGSLPALLPFLTERFDLSYTMVGALVLAATFSSSIIQPAFGLWSDARGALWLLPAGVAVAGLGLAFAAVAPSYALVMLGVLVSGVGVAAYHPGDAATVEELLEQADAALYRAKSAGRNRVALYEGDAAAAAG